VQPAAVACLAFLVGSIPTGVIITRLVRGSDIRQVGSGNIGASNVARAAGIKIGALVAVLDIVKGAAPVVFGRGLGLDHRALAIVGLAAVLGHDFSIFLRFRGGKGVATTLGVLLALTPVPALIAVAVWVVVMTLSRYSSLASLAALAVLPALVALAHQPAEYVVLAVVLALLGIAKHWENIIRLRHGTERRFGTRGATGG